MDVSEQSWPLRLGLRFGPLVVVALMSWGASVQIRICP